MAGSTPRRVARAGLLFRAACVAWLPLILVAQLLHFPYLNPAWRSALWELSLGALGWLWVGTTVWSGAVHLGYRGIGSRTLYRSEAPAEFWSHVAVGAVFVLALTGLGIFHLWLHP